MTMTAHFEPAAFGSCRIELSCWANILQVLQPLITHIAVLESLLEGGLAAMSAAGKCMGWPGHVL